jgi:alpha-L-rhamnosidase
LGDLKQLSVRYPHPRGEVVAQYVLTAHGLHAEITLPAGLQGTFEWHGQSRRLESGKTMLDLP